MACISISVKIGYTTEGKLSYNDVLNKYAATHKEHLYWFYKTRVILGPSADIEYEFHSMETESLTIGLSAIRRMRVEKAIHRLQLEVKENNAIIQYLERRQKKYLQAIEMYNRIITEFEIT